MLAAAGCTPPVAFEDSGPAVFEGAIGTYLVEAFDAVPADIDLDGDADLIVNGHHVVPLQIFVNEGGIFQRVNAPGSDRSGVHDNRGVPYLFASAAEMARSFAVDAEVPPGLYVWHDDWRLGSWRLRWVPPVEGAPRSLTLRTPRRFTATEGLEPDEARTPDPAEITVELAGEPRSLALRSEAMSGELALRLEPSASIFLGPSRSPAPTQARRGTGTPAGRGELRIWKPDPHGIAWVDVEGSPHPEIYATRGGLAGFLRAPLPPKTDRYYVHRGYGADPLYTFAPEGTLEAGYRRGRGVEWVDVNGDGSLDLSISARASRNGLLIRDPVSGGLRDRAAELGLDFQAAEVASWADFDEDGWQDQFILRGAELDIARNVGGNRFEIIPGRQLGIVLPPVTGDPGKPLFETTVLRLSDFDLDGRLDLYVLGYGAAGTHHLFLRDGEGYRDVSREVGLEAAPRASVVALLDVDEDGFEDAVAFASEIGGEAGTEIGTGTWLWHNRSGQAFDLVPLTGLSGSRPVSAAAVLDADTDGLLDLVVVDDQLRLLRNVTPREHRSFRLVLEGGTRPPVGALIRVHYDDGHVLARRYGSVYNTRLSQGLLPLHFGTPAGAAISHVTVQWPGLPEPSRYPPPAEGPRSVITIRRPSTIDGGADGDLSDRDPPQRREKR